MFLFLFGILLGGFIYYKIFKPNKYWDEKRVPHPPSWPLLGNMLDTVLRKKHFFEIARDIYREYPNHRYVGFLHFTNPVLLLTDLELIKQVTIKEFDSFHDHMPFDTADSDEIASKSLLNLRGDKWKEMRSTISPAFTSSKMKNMFNLMTDCTKSFTDHFQNDQSHEVEMKDLMAKFATNVIASTAFGIEANAVKDPTCDFFQMSRKLMQSSFSQVAKLLLLQISPKLAKSLNVSLMPDEVITFYSKIILNNIDDRIKHKIVRPDLIHLLLEARKGQLNRDQDGSKSEGFAATEESDIGRRKRIELTDNHIIAQALLFFFAGLETVSTALSFMAYELAVNPDVQTKLQEEIDSIDGDLTYETLISMKYMDQVVCETLRMWPPGFQVQRHCNQDLVIEPIQSTERRFVIEKGMTIGIPIAAIHRDQKFYPEPDRFDPERFNEENKSKIVAGSFLPFGLGPRNCIGSRFALLELKTLFYHLLSKFDLIPNEKTVVPMVISPKMINLSPENGFQLTLKPRKLK